MEYPKQIMRMSELAKIGFPVTYLLSAYRTPGQTFASKINPLKENSPIIFDTTGLEVWRQKSIKSQERRTNP